MDLVEFFTDGLKKYADFSGRATRKQYWMFSLAYFILYLIFSVADIWVGTGGLLGTAFSLVCSVPLLSIGARRLHDAGHSGWWQLLPVVTLLPVVGFVGMLFLDDPMVEWLYGSLALWLAANVVLVIFLSQASREDNKYGPRIQSDPG
jgi:uncharacterized membrane protein YhaH (DUF805 family)